jgi:hypothetical protein
MYAKLVETVSLVTGEHDHVFLAGGFERPQTDRTLCICLLYAMLKLLN